MRLNNLILAAALGLGLCAPLMACSSTGSAPSTAVVAVPAVVTLDETKALYAAEAAYNGLASAASTAVDTGLLKGASAQKAATLLTQAHTALVTARAAYTLGQSQGVATQAAAVLSIAAQLEPLLDPAS